jgi:hypothetical protein
MMPPPAVSRSCSATSGGLTLFADPRRLSAAVQLRLPIRLLDAVASPERLVAPALERMQIRPDTFTEHGDVSSFAKLLRGGKAVPSEIAREIGVLLDLIHPLIFRRRSFATVGTNFD